MSVVCACVVCVCVGGGMFPVNVEGARPEAEGRVSVWGAAKWRCTGIVAAAARSRLACLPAGGLGCRVWQQGLSKVQGLVIAFVGVFFGGLVGGVG